MREAGGGILLFLSVFLFGAAASGQPGDNPRTSTLLYALGGAALVGGIGLLLEGYAVRLEGKTADLSPADQPAGRKGPPRDIRAVAIVVLVVAGVGVVGALAYYAASGPEAREPVGPDPKPGEVKKQADDSGKKKDDKDKAGKKDAKKP